MPAQRFESARTSVCRTNGTKKGSRGQESYALFWLRRAPYLSRDSAKVNAIRHTPKYLIIGIAAMECGRSSMT